MNGRIYDPLLGRFLSADPKVPGPHDLQAYNRYAYVLNNPLRFTDPDGHEPKDVAAGAIEGPAHAIIETGSNNPGLANLNEMAATFSFVARLFGNESKAQYFDSVHQDGVQMQQSVENVTEQAKTAASDVASKLTGSADVNNSQRAITRTGTNLLTKMFVALGGSHLASRLGDAKINNGSGDKGQLSQTPAKTQGDNRGKYAHLKEPRTVGPGLKTTPAQRARILAENKQQNGGVLRSDQSGTELAPPKKLNTGDQRPPNEAQVDHIEERSKGGSNSNANQQVLSFEENLEKELKRRQQQKP